MVHWNGACVLEPSGPEDLQDLPERATAHLLELRDPDDLPSRELHRLYDELERGGSRLTHVPTREVLTLQRRIAAPRLEPSEMIERLENAAKIVGELHLARRRPSAVRRLRLAARREEFPRERKPLAEANDPTADAADPSRSEPPEVAVVPLILQEAVAALR